MDEHEILAALGGVEKRIAAAEEAAGRPKGSVTLIAVSKTKPVEAIEAAWRAGQRHFGENRVQEAQTKYPALKEAHPKLVLHLIGPLQTNKARESVRLFDSIHTLDRPKLARVLAEEMERASRRPEILIQVNTGEEPQKAGVVPGELDALVDYARWEMDLPLVGLMCIPPLEEPPGPHFALLADLAEKHGLKQLSMGMSGDYEQAIALGATHVRVGSAIFGERPAPD